MANLRVFDVVSLRMQRVGYLKRLIRRVTNTPTSNLENVGNDLIDTLLKRNRVQINDALAIYIKARLTGNAYTTIKKETNTWLKTGGEAPFLLLELQDLYLADPSLPSQVGRLVKEDWRKYPQFGMNLGLIRTGTYSATTRAFSFLHLVSDQEQQAFTEFIPSENPFFISVAQSILLIYSFLENDGEVLVPLWKKLVTNSTASFNEREAGDLLPSILRNVIARYKGKLIPVELRKRFEALGKVADNIALQLNVQNYSSVSPREDNVRVRLEPTVDLGVLQKVNPLRYEYTFSTLGVSLANTFSGDEDSVAIGEFLRQRFFSTIASAKGISTKIMPSEEIIPGLINSWKAISSSNGYAPIEEIALLAGIKALVNEKKIIEIAAARDTLIAYQKANPYAVRFTVDRLGALAHAKFIDDTNR